MVKIKLYAEGGGSSRALKRACRRGFRKFIEKSGLKGTMPEIVASGSRRNAYDDFATRHHHIRLPRMNVRCFWLTRRGRYGNPGRGNTSRTVMAGTSLRARQTTNVILWCRSWNHGFWQIPRPWRNSTVKASGRPRSERIRRLSRFPKSTSSAAFAGLPTVPQKAVMTRDPTVSRSWRQ